MFWLPNDGSLEVTRYRPIASRAIERFDPELRLVWNKQFQTFSIMRARKFQRRFWFDGFGWLTYIDDLLVHVFDWTDGLEGRDDPDPILRYLFYSDIFRFPNLEKEGRQRILDQRAKMEARVHDEYRHAFLDNKRLLVKAWQPFVDSPSIVR